MPIISRESINKYQGAGKRPQPRKKNLWGHRPKGDALGPKGRGQRDSTPGPKGQGCWLAARRAAAVGPKGRRQPKCQFYRVLIPARSAESNIWIIFQVLKNMFASAHYIKM